MHFSTQLPRSDHLSALLRWQSSQCTQFKISGRQPESTWICCRSSMKIRSCTLLCSSLSLQHDHHHLDHNASPNQMQCNPLCTGCELRGDFFQKEGDGDPRPWKIAFELDQSHCGCIQIIISGIVSAMQGKEEQEEKKKNEYTRANCLVSLLLVAIVISAVVPLCIA